MDDDDIAPSRLHRALARRGADPVALIARYDTWGFATDLDGLDLSGVFSVLLFPEANQAAFPPDLRQRFDLALPLQAANMTAPSVLGALSAVRLPEIEAALDAVLAVVPADQVCLIAMEEELQRPFAALRARYGLAGPHPADMARFVDKSAMKVRFHQHGVSAPRAVLVEEVPSDDGAALAAFQAGLEAQLRFPLFIKPSDGVASAAAARLETSADLGAWLAGHRGSRRTYVLEEFLVGTEFFAYGLAQGGELSILSIDEMNQPMFEAVEAAMPVAELSLSRADPEFSRISAFVQEVFRAVSPVPGGCFVAQLMRRRSDGTLVIIEVSARVPGDIAPRTLRWATGLNIEVAHISLQLPGRRQVVVPERQRSVATLLFPRRPGVVRALRPPPAVDAGTEVSLTWLAAVGESLPSPQTYDDVACVVQLGGVNHASLVADYRQFLAWSPLILDGEENP